MRQYVQEHMSRYLVLNSCQVWRLATRTLEAGGPLASHESFNEISALRIRLVLGVYYRLAILLWDLTLTSSSAADLWQMSLGKCSYSYIYRVLKLH